VVKKGSKKRGASVKGGSSKKGVSAKKAAPARGRSAVGNPILDAGARHDIIAIALCVVGVALIIAVVSGQSGEQPGLATQAISFALRFTFGVGAYLIPVGLVLWGASMFVAEYVHQARTGIGIAIVLLAIIAFAALFTPLEPTLTGMPRDLSAYVSSEAAPSYGGMVGGGLTWVLVQLFGPWITGIVYAGMLIGGLVVLGLSITGLVSYLRDFLVESLWPESEFDESFNERVRGESAAQTVVFEDDATDTGANAPESLLTQVLPQRKGRKRERSPAPEDAPTTAPVAKTVAPRAMEGFELPAFSALTKTSESASHHRASEKELRETADVIVETLGLFEVPARVERWVAGPTVTLFEIEIAKGVRLSKITALADDLALALAASTVRILAPIPGKSLIGVEVPNVRRSSVTLGDVLIPAGKDGPLLLGIGKDVTGAPVLADLADMPHLLIGGSTGSGKSVAINAMLMSIIMRSTPAEVRLILIDPKRIELSSYNEVPHLYVPVVTEAKEAASALAWAVSEMERRLKIFQAAKARNIGMYNDMIQQGKGAEAAEELPYLVIVIDELADLMMIAAKEVEDSICRLAQLARAAGIHLIVATQRPEANVVTGLIKANITNRIAFSVASALDSRVVLDQSGAEKLTGKGDMLYSRPDLAKPKRIQGCFVSESEIEAVVEHLKTQAESDYHNEILQLKVAASGGGVDTGGADDPLLWEAADIVVTSGVGSTSMLQRRLKVGYARAGRIMDMLEAIGVVGQPDGSKPREVIVDVEELEAIKAFEREDASGANGMSHE